MSDKRERTLVNVSLAVIVVLLVATVVLAAYSATQSTALRAELERAHQRRLAAEQPARDAIDAQLQRSEAIAMARTLHFVLNHQDDPAALETLGIDASAPAQPRQENRERAALLARHRAPDLRT